MAFTIKVNGVPHSVDVDEDTPLLWVLRDVLGIIGSIGNKAITTIEAVGKTPQGRSVQKAWLDVEVVQCGYCQSGQIMSAAALLAAKPKPSDADIDAAMSGNICRCGTYVRIREGIKHAARGLANDKRGS